jgi:iron(II)-dependent oxidoreductase
VPTKPEIAEALHAARDRSLALLDPVPPTDQTRQVSPLMSPLCWDLAHIGHFEELWLVRELTGAPPTDPLFDDVYDAFKHPRTERPSLPMLDPVGAREFDADVRGRVLDVLGRLDLDTDRPDPLVADGFVYGMVVQHEHQHDETMLATLQLMEGFAHPAADGADPPLGGARTTPTLPPDLLVDGGEFTIGTDSTPWAYDNERPAHTVALAPFRIDTTPVTNAAYTKFVVDGGYDDERLWSDAGWAWRKEAALVAPQFWERDGNGGWLRTRFGRTEEVPADEPVQHVCWYEADAFARWAGARLPTEAEWERAAAGADPTAGNLWRSGARFGPEAVGRRADAASTAGATQLFGDVWEWTSSDFRGYPAFRSFPYREYSEVFFGAEYKVLRGGSWATDPAAMRSTFRNWDFPIRRQIFAGFRCARDA